MTEETVKEEKLIGEIVHYFGKIGVAIIKLSDSLKIGDTIHIIGSKTNFSQVVDSIEINHQKVKEAKSGESVGVKVSQKVKEGYKVYKS